jgi:hypothetical protein
MDDLKSLSKVSISKLRKFSTASLSYIHGSPDPKSLISLKFQETVNGFRSGQYESSGIDHKKNSDDDDESKDNQNVDTITVTDVTSMSSTAKFRMGMINLGAKV